MTFQSGKLINSVALTVALLWGVAAQADDYVAQWAPPVGTALPMLEAQDQTGQTRDFENLAGENGLLIMLNRSADW